MKTQKDKSKETNKSHWASDTESEVNSTDGSIVEASTETLWDLLLEEGPIFVRETLDVLARDPSIETSTRSFIQAKLFDLEAASWYAGAEPLAEVTRILRQTLHGPLSSAEKLEELLYNGLTALDTILKAMASPIPDEKTIIENLGYFDGLKKKSAQVQRELTKEKTGEPFEPMASSKDEEEPFDTGVWIPNVAADMVPAFFEECSERLESLSEKLLELEEIPDDKDLLAAIFRDLHTIKGSSAFVGLSPLNRLAHKAEDLVGELRDGKRRVNTPVVDALLLAKDSMSTILQRAGSKKSLSDMDLKGLLNTLNNPTEPSLSLSADDFSSTGETNMSQLNGAREKPDRAGWTVRESSSLDEVKAESRSKGEGSHNKLSGRATIRVDFGKLDVLLNLVGELVLDRASVRSVLGNLDSASRALETTQKSLQKYRRLSKKKTDSGTNAIRDIVVVHEEMDRISRLFKELVRELDVSTGSLDFVAGNLRDQVMNLRMVPISQVFTKHKRTVRDLAKSLNKKAKLELIGQETELDKMLVEKLDEPLLHLVRNAVDHGIEDPQTRIRAGKEEMGVVVLSAKHQGGQLIIEVIDDGKGLNPEVVKKKAIETGLLETQEAAKMDSSSLLRLIFSPGFSTAGKVTHISGRGVGMDVVNETVRRLRGSIDITSIQGKGTTMTMALPLTLAIRQILLMQVSGELIALPLDNVVRTLDLNEADVNKIGENMILESDESSFPLIDPSTLLGYANETNTADKQIVCIKLLGKRYGIICDGVRGQHEIVVKTLGDLLHNVPCAAGATLVGEQVVIILDAPALIKRWEKNDSTGFVRGPTSIPTPIEKQEQRRVLIAEDSPPARALIKQQFEALGFSVKEAVDGQEALVLAKSEFFHLISTDARMPHMDGYELAKNLRSYEKTKSIPILMVSALGERIDKVRGFDAGIDMYLVKPTELPQLHEAVSKLLSSPLSRKEKK